MKPLYKFILAAVLALGAGVPSFAAAPAANTFVRFQTDAGLMDLKLLDAEAPVTVANFLGYVRRGDYTDSFFHRSVANFVIQVGGYKWPSGSNYIPIPTQPAIVNEFSPTRSNVRGTVAMAKVGGNPNSATSQWFVNLADNSANLDAQNGGFTVFARVSTTTMATADAIAALHQYTITGDPVFGTNALPLLQAIWGRPYVARFVTVREMNATTLNDRIFNYLEAAYPAYVTAAPDSTGEAFGYIYRYYAGTNSFVGVKDGHVYYYAPGWMSDVFDVGLVDTWSGVAQAAGY